LVCVKQMSNTPVFHIENLLPEVFIA
jgi:hypothetical protein